MTTTLLETWKQSRSLASNGPSLKPVLNELVDSGSEEISQTIAQLREVDRDEAVELQAVARAVACRSDLEIDGVHRQVQLLLLPVLMTLTAGPAEEPKHMPDIPAGLMVEATLERALGLEQGSLRAAPFLVSAMTMSELSLSDMRDLGMHLATMGDYGRIAPALLEREPDLDARYALYLPMVWVGDPEASLPSGLAEQGPRPGYMPAKMRIEECLEQELSERCGLSAKLTVFKPVSYPMAFTFLRRAMLAADLRQLAKRAGQGGLAGSTLSWKLSRDMLTLNFALGKERHQLQTVVPEETEQALVELLGQLAASQKVGKISRLGS